MSAPPGWLLSIRVDLFLRLRGAAKEVTGLLQAVEHRADLVAIFGGLGRLGLEQGEVEVAEQQDDLVGGGVEGPAALRQPVDLLELAAPAAGPARWIGSSGSAD